jgi:protease-4
MAGDNIFDNDFSMAKSEPLVPLENKNTEADDGADVSPKENQRVRGRGKLRGFFIFILLLVIVLGFALWQSDRVNMRAIFSGDFENAIFLGSASEKYIAVINVSGEISSHSKVDVALDDSLFDPAWAVSKIRSLANDPANVGLVVNVDSPGGSAYLSDIIYNALKNYKLCGKTYYAAFGEMAASGGYYIAAPADKIFADRNTLTGSIGVTFGTQFDISGLLEKYGVKTETIVSSENKAMGNIFEPMTDEQKSIFQGLIDETYNRFLDIVAEGRDIKKSKVRELADGRLYTAKQAMKLNLIDNYCNWELAAMSMADELGVSADGYTVRTMNRETSLFDAIFSQGKSIAEAIKSAGDKTGVNSLVEALAEEGESPIMYLYKP